MSKVLTYGLIVLDLLAFLAATSFASCFSSDTQTCQKSITSPVTWFLIVLALISTAFYLYKRHQAGSSILPFNFLGEPNVPWIYALYYFFALIFWGENVPEIAGYLKGLPLGAPGTHASLMNPELFFQGNSGTTLNLITFGGMAFAIAFFFRKFNLLAAVASTVVMGALIEYVTKLGKPQGGPEGFDVYSNPWGSMLNFMWLWLLLALVPYVIFALFNRAWKTRGVIVLIVLMVILNIASYFYFRYQIYDLKNIQPGFLSSSSGDILPAKTCPDQLMMDNGKPIAYKNGQPFQVGNQSDLDWIKTNCPNLQNQTQR